MSHSIMEFGRPQSAVDSGAVQPLPLARATLFFVLASLGDLGLTTYLIQHPSSSFYESNPVAAWVLFTWGIQGMAIFKLSLVSLVCAIAYRIACERRDVAQKLMSGATLIVSCVIIYSVLLYVGVTTHEQLYAGLE